ncbi:MAG TPA: hypothetical protein VL860_05425, partial [Planctomycetota bacterium]|nr:hypothetical protein [Planctomycetota bacterium]
RLAGLLKAEVAKAPDRTILIDTGAWAAGGPLDGRSAGAASDLERSRLMLEFMHACNYDLIALGDEELALGQQFYSAAARTFVLDPGKPTPPVLPLTCANLDLTPAQRKDLHIEKFIGINTPAGMYWIVGLSPPGKYAFDKEGFQATDPEPVLRALIAEAAADQYHPRIILASHLGDAATEALLTSLVKKPVLDAGGKPIDPGIIVAVLAGHHRPAEVRQSVAATPVLYVRGEGQYVSAIEFRKGGGFPRLAELPVDATAPADPAAAKIADQIRALISIAPPQIDITFATDCPHCVTALEPVLKILARLEGPPIHRMAPPVPLAEVRLRFMVHRTADGRWITGIQPGTAAETKSYEETRRLLIVQKYDPEAVWPLLRWRKNNPEADFSDGLKAIQFVAWRMQGALDAHEDEPLLEENRVLTEQRRVPGTPSIYLQGKLYEGPSQELPLMSAVCALLRARGTADAEPALPCKGVPRCFQDGDCTKPGFIAHCLDAGKPTAECKFIEDQEVTVWVVQDAKAVHSNASELIGQLGKFFAKLKVEGVASDSELGKKIIAASRQTTLPIYAVKNLPDAVNQADVEKFGKYIPAAGTGALKDQLFVLEPLPFYSHDYFQRERQPGRLDVFYEVHSPNAAKAILRLIATLEMRRKQQAGAEPQIVLHPLVYLQATDAAHLQPEQLIARGGLGELEQSALLLAVRAAQPQHALAYAGLLAQAPGSIYWEQPLKQLGLDPAALAERAHATAVTVELREEAKLARELRMQGDIAFLVRNQELVPIQNGEELYRVLGLLSQDLAAAPTMPPPAPTKTPGP